MIQNAYIFDTKLSYDETKLITALRALCFGREFVHDILFEMNTMSLKDNDKWAEVIYGNLKEDVKNYIGDILNVDFIERKGVKNG